MVNCLGNGTTIGTPANTANIVAEFYLAKPPATSFSGACIASAIVNHRMPRDACIRHYLQKLFIAFA